MVQPDLAVFSPEELTVIDEIIAFASGFTAKGLENLAQKSFGYRATEQLQGIPYELFLIADDQPTREEGLVVAAQD